MRRNLRNILAELLLCSFNDSEKRAAIELLAEFCRLAAGRGEAVLPLSRLPMRPSEAEPTGTGIGIAKERRTDSDRDRDSERGGGTPRGAEKLAGMEKLFRIRRADAGEAVAGENASHGGRDIWLVEPVPDVRAGFPAVCERVRIYAGLVSRMGTCDLRARDRDPLVKAMAEAALCFNAGLFFEAHEHLEHHWVAAPKGPTKRFLQGVIQISVGFHQACAGKYDGAINQLRKGLEKTAGTAREFLGLDCDVFLPKVAAVRDAIVKRGRARMRALTLQEIPHMPIRNPPSPTPL
jgi:hypothetical protein